jgi:hypothetical protein
VPGCGSSKFQKVLDPDLEARITHLTFNKKFNIIFAIGAIVKIP